MLQLKNSIRLCILFFFVFNKLSIQAQTVSGSLANSATVCANSNNGILTLSGYVGNIIRWEYSLNGLSLWTSISNTSSSYNYINLSQTTYFRVIVQAPTFSALASNTVVITTSNASNGGTPSVLSVSECVGNNVKVTLNGYVGNVLSWQSSTNNGFSWGTIPSSGDSISKYDANISSNTLYRAIVQNGVCPSTVSDSVKVSVTQASVGGIVSGSATVCSGLNSNTINLSGQTGNVVRWESSTGNSSPWISIVGTNTNLVYTNIINSGYYRAIVKNGNCMESPSLPVFINVNNPSNGGFVTGTQQVCSNLNNGALSLNGYNGTVLQWESSTNGGSIWSNSPISASTYNVSNLTQNTMYRAQVVNGVCPPAHSNTFLVTVNPLPIVNYTYNANCQGKAMGFVNTSVGSNSYNWDFKDGFNSTNTNPLHTYLSSGNYLVKLIATSINGCTDSMTKTITVFPKPNVNFTSLDSTCSFNQIICNNNTSISTGTISGYAWSFGDQSPINTSANVNHTYTSPNTYAIKLIATSDNNCIDSIVKTVTIFPKPVANFITQNVCKKSFANFTNTSYVNSGNINYQWNFGDANASVLTSPTHSYITVGGYSVSLITVSNHNCKDTVIKSVYINEQPDLLINVPNGCLNKPSVFTHTVTSPTAYTLHWNLGNGNVLMGANQNYTYPVSGNYNITATLTTDSGCVSVQTTTTAVHPLPYMAFSINNVCSSDTAHSINLCTISSGSLNYFWDFGNNTSSVLVNPKIKYALPGTYSVQLITTTNYGCKDSLTQPITVFHVPTTNFNFTNSCESSPVTFSNTSTINVGVISHYAWDFGDNSNSTIINPIKNYSGFGSYTVTLETTSSNGCKSNTSKTVSVYEGAKANFSFSDKCVDQSISFTNSTALNTGTYYSLWNFGDTNSSTLNSPNHIYDTDGTKNVTLKVTTNNGCVDSVIKQVQVFALPIINAGKDTTISKGFGVTLQATGANIYSWHPAVGLSNPTIYNPVANPNETTIYMVEGINTNGCYSSDTVIITIEDDVLLIPYNIVTPDGNGKNDIWVVRNIENYPNNKLAILDEWGVLVFEQSTYTNTWDGRNKQGNILPDGTYYYILTFSDNKKVYKGFITLLRNR